MNQSMSIGPKLTPGVKKLLIINVIIFGLQFFSRMFSSPYSIGPIESLLALWPEKVSGSFYVWQLFTYQFLHGGFFHLFFNMWALWMFGSDVEERWGTREFIKFYLICGLGAGVLIFLVNSIFLSSDSVTLGASGAVLGVLLPYAMFWPDRYLIVMFVLPVKTKYLVAIVGAISLFSTVGGRADGVSHVGHLGGIITAYFYIRYYKKKNVFAMLGLFSSTDSMAHKIKMWQKKKVWDKRKVEYDDFQSMQLKVDQILDKITRLGIHSLTVEERDFLKKASRNMDRDDDIIN